MKMHLGLVALACILVFGCNSIKQNGDNTVKQVQVLSNNCSDAPDGPPEDKDCRDQNKCNTIIV